MSLFRDLYNQARKREHAMIITTSHVMDALYAGELAPRGDPFDMVACRRIAVQIHEAYDEFHAEMELVSRQNGIRMHPYWVGVKLVCPICNAADCPMAGFVFPQMTHTLAMLLNFANIGEDEPV